MAMLCAVADLKKNGLDEQVKKAEESFISEPYQSSKNGGMVNDGCCYGAR